MARINEHAPCPLRIAAAASLRGADNQVFLQAVEDVRAAGGSFGGVAG